MPRQLRPSIKAQRLLVTRAMIPGNLAGLLLTTGALTKSIAPIPTVLGLAAFGALRQVISLLWIVLRTTIPGITRYGLRGTMGLAPAHLALPVTFLVMALVRLEGTQLLV